MTVLQWINTIIAVIGVPSILLACIYFGRKLQLLESVSKSTEKIKHNMQVVSSYLIRHHHKFDSSELQALSPLQLTAKGKELISGTGFENIFASNKNEFFDFIEGEKPKLKYDVEIAAVRSIYVAYEKSYMDFLKVYLYNHPERSLENVAPTFGIYIRDKYLEKHPEITQ